VDTAEQVYVALQHAAKRLRDFDEAIGLSPARFSVLATLRYAGPQRVGELARQERVAQPTMTQLVNGMEAAGLVVRNASPDDRRGCTVELTPHGRAVVRRARARKIAWITDVIEGLSTAELQALHAAAATLDQHAREAG
jgi:DNA-binding MarR family transcriptional regulator